MERVAGLPIVLSQGWGCLQVVRQNFIDRPCSSTCVLPSGNHSSGSYQREMDGASLAAEGELQLRSHCASRWEETGQSACILGTGCDTYGQQGRSLTSVTVISISMKACHRNVFVSW